ncbi:MAG: YgiQ family radical SAM protein [Bacteroidales bacterium]|nr:YgiQ family radical SAM protein [Bacteroidales bacterium]
MNFNKTESWLPCSVKEVKSRGWTQPDIILISGDAYIDHPSFGIAVIGRVLEKAGYKVAIVPQPNWRDDLRDFKKLGAPKLFFGVSSGSMDSMVNHYTAGKRLRSDDAYTPGNKAGYRPDYALSIYSQMLKKLFPQTPVVIGGIEGSLRRLSHYDYWSDSLKPSVLIESKADILVYGMGEKSILEIAEAYKTGKNPNILEIPQTVVLRKNAVKDSIELFSHEICLKDKKAFASNFKIIETESNKLESRILTQKTGSDFVTVFPPFYPIGTKEIDNIYDLPYTRLPHPKYIGKPAIPAFEMIKHSVNIHRGCFGGCSFCTLAAHQGKVIISRSEDSILKEVEQITKMEDFKGYISDLGGPSANMYKMVGKDLEQCKKCSRPSCVYPKICNNLESSHKALLSLYSKAAKIIGVKKLFIGSGIRYDIPLLNGEINYLEEVMKNHVSGRLKVAPEHTEDKVLKAMRKPSFSLYYKVDELMKKVNIKYGLKQQLIPYFISSHPDCSNQDMAQLAVKTKNLGLKPEQVQDFTPTPMTLASVMHYSGINPYTGEKVLVTKNQEDKTKQKSFFFFHKKEYQKGISKELSKMKRDDIKKKLFNSNSTATKKKRR